LRGFSQEPIVFGYAGPLSGPVSYFGISAVKSVELAVSEINAQGGIMGRPVTLEAEDTQGRPDQATIAVQRLSERADFLIGIYTSESLLAVLPLLAQIRKPLLGTGAATPLATIQVAQNYQNLKYFFRVGPLNSVFLIQENVDFARDFLVGKLGWDSVVILAEDAEWNRPITDGLEALNIPPLGDSFNAIGLTTLDVIRYAIETTDFSGIYSDAAKTGADTFFTLMAHTGVTPTLQWAQVQPPMPFVGINVQAQMAVFDQLTGGAAESVVTLTSATRAFITDKTIPYYDAFAQFAPEVLVPAYTGPISYDAAYILKEAIERAGTTEADEVVKALEETDYIGTVGRIQFYLAADAAGGIPFVHDVVYHNRQDPRKKNVAGIWIQWQGGEQKVIYPFEYTLGEPGSSFVLPPWMRGGG